MHRERRLDVGEGRDDDAPDALHGIERQNAFVAVDQAAHHVGLARGAEGGAGLLRLLDGDQPVNDLAAFHEEPMHRCIDAIDVAPQIGERRDVGTGCFGHGDLTRADLSSGCRALHPGHGSRSRSARKQRKR